MRRSPRMALPILWAAGAVLTLLSLTLALPASADTATPVSQCSSGDRSYTSVGATSATATAPEGYRIASFCVVGRGNAGAERHTLATPRRTTVVSHSSGKQLESYSVTYVKTPVASEPEPDQKTTAPREEPTADVTADAPEEKAEPSSSAATEKSLAPGESSSLGRLPTDGEELRVTTFEERDEREDRWSLLVVGGIIVVGLVAGAIALTVRLPGQR
ncbi:hypothetical protein ACFVDI_07620 [Nocardioides sp. NPDC057767]|uniref:hypothetical protein n=1 Tax=unclassified Nocardioides TaxID=2615069 RepID=UPI00366F4989